MEVVFDKKTHSYTLGSLKLPSVTGILWRTGLIDKKWFTDYAAERGTFVHEACTLLDQGKLIEESLDEALKPYLESYKSFKRLEMFDWDLIEIPRANEKMGFAGTPDRVQLSKIPVILDIKSGVKLDWHGEQLAGYALLINMPFAKRYSLYLNKNGKIPKLVEYKDHRDMDNFMFALEKYKKENEK